MPSVLQIGLLTTQIYEQKPSNKPNEKWECWLKLDANVLRLRLLERPTKQELICKNAAARFRQMLDLGDEMGVLASTRNVGFFGKFASFW